MTISAMMNFAVSGLQANAAGLSVAAANVANAATPGHDRQAASFVSTPSGVETRVTGSGAETFDDASNVDLTAEIVSTVLAEHGFLANAAVWETGAEIWDVLAAIKRD